MRSHDNFMTYVAAVLFVMFIGGWLFHDCAQQDECRARGGHVHPVYKSWICVDAEGRIVEDLSR